MSMHLNPESLLEKKDEELVRLYQKTGKKEIIGILYRRHSHKILGLCINYLKSIPDAEDAVMEVIEKLFNDLRTYQIDNFSSWLFFVTRNHCLKKLQSRLKRHQEEISEISPDFFMEIDEESDHYIEIRLENLSDAIDQLKDDQKRCIVLFYLEQKSYKEIQADTSYSFDEVKSHLQNGRRNLRNALMRTA